MKIFSLLKMALNSTLKRSKNYSVSDESRAYDHDFHEAFATADKARNRLTSIPPHRSLTRLKVRPNLLLQALLFPVVLCGLLLWMQPQLLEFWRYCIIFWSAQLDLPFSLSSQINGVSSPLSLLWQQTGPGGLIPIPSLTNFAVTTAATLLILALSFRMKNKITPLKYLLQIICGVQVCTLIFYQLNPARFTGSIARHSEELMVMGFVVMLATPVMLAIGYYILNQSLLSKLTYTVIILLFFTVMVPHQVLVHALILKNVSTLVMPLLYICFGAVFDAIVFIALYAWVASKAPLNATN